ncbi:hypothetical protein J31TS3_46370 [Paenibacillus lactis]|nr:hypothetical protein J31TS3_46370 [Paenibacillus lactis]
MITDPFMKQVLPPERLTIRREAFSILYLCKPIISIQSQIYGMIAIVFYEVSSFLSLCITLDPGGNPIVVN